MKILFLTSQLPYPPDKGATIRTFALVKGLSQRRHQVHLLSFINSDEDLVWLPQMRPYFASMAAVRSPSRSKLARLCTLFLSPLPDMVWRLPSQEFSERLSETIAAESFDIVQVESMEMARYAMEVVEQRPAGVKKPIVVFDNLNAEYVLQRRAFEVDRRRIKTWPKAIYSWLQWRRLQRYERTVCRAVDTVLTVSETDAAALAYLDKTIDLHVVPNGVDCSFFSAEAQPAAYPPQTQIKHLASVIFTATMQFRPNIDAVLWFCQDILPLVKKDAFHVHFYIVGNAPPAEVRTLASPAVTVTGYVSDIRPYIANSMVYVVPMRIGSGTRLKILEAMAMHIPVVSTTVGAEGIDVTPGQNILIGDTPADFAHHVVNLLGNAAERTRLADNARRLVEDQYDWTTIVPNLEKAYSQAMISVQ